MDKHIKVRLPPDEHAEIAYQEGFYVEAIQILHGWVENQARGLFALVGTVHFGAKSQDTWDLADTFSLNDCLKALYVLNQIDKTEFETWRELNSMRNRIVHQIYKDPYEKIYQGVPRAEYDRVFKETLNQAYFFTRKTEEIIEL